MRFAREQGKIARVVRCYRLILGALQRETMFDVDRWLRSLSDSYFRIARARVHSQSNELARMAKLRMLFMLRRSPSWSPLSTIKVEVTVNGDRRRTLEKNVSHFCARQATNQGAPISKTTKYRSVFSSSLSQKFSPGFVSKLSNYLRIIRFECINTQCTFISKLSSNFVTHLIS